jgi:hypothetical protein
MFASLRKSLGSMRNSARVLTKHVLLPRDERYSPAYYVIGVESTAAPSAKVMAESIYAWLRPQSIIDVGVGLAHFLPPSATVALGNCSALNTLRRL